MKINSQFQFGDFISLGRLKELTFKAQILKTPEAHKQLKVVCIKKYWREMDPLVYAFIVLEDLNKSSQQWTP